MSVSPIGPGYPVTRLQGSTAVSRSGGSTDVSQSSQDTVEISDSARYLSALKDLPDVRQDKVDSVKSQLQAGTYETSDKVDSTVDSLLSDWQS
jgi:flagellar biosynthesis anti-sigma factor FlgM